ncbi:AIG2-like family-domain-containing protein [Chaetomium strumarium]|uniref:Putative gamma-glutamylcyclotransferase n=1 Tax=Chaetomium strumarium TaxID=1170767 RepID=A0AAJ0GZ12_9PEZI|nr:AIG2-like family-domain-containing protein [Chaetomium strumarium]
MASQNGARSAKSDERTYCAFFYGTLMVPEVFYSVCYLDKNPPKAITKLHTFHPAILPGYCRRRVKYADYPGIVADNGHQVFGTYATGLTRANMAKLDFFEGRQYERRTVTVTVLPGQPGNPKGQANIQGKEEKAEVYVFLDPRELEEEEWDLEEFRREKLRFWTRGGHAFEDCDPTDTAAVAGAESDAEAGAERADSSIAQAN